MDGEHEMSRKNKIKKGWRIKNGLSPLEITKGLEEIDKMASSSTVNVNKDDKIKIKIDGSEGTITDIYDIDNKYHFTQTFFDNYEDGKFKVESSDGEFKAAESYDSFLNDIKTKTHNVNGEEQPYYKSGSKYYKVSVFDKTKGERVTKYFFDTEIEKLPSGGKRRSRKRNQKKSKKNHKRDPRKSRRHRR